MHRCRRRRSGSRAARSPDDFLLEGDELAKLLDARGEILFRDLEEAVYGEALDGKGAHRASAHHCPAHRTLAQVSRSREVAEEAAGERVPGARGIEHALERIRRREEHALRVEHERAMLALLAVSYTHLRAH